MRAMLFCKWRKCKLLHFSSTAEKFCDSRGFSRSKFEASFEAKLKANVFFPFSLVFVHSLVVQDPFMLKRLRNRRKKRWPGRELRRVSVFSTWQNQFRTAKYCNSRLWFMGKQRKMKINLVSDSPRIKEKGGRTVCGLLNAYERYGWMWIEIASGKLFMPRSF